MTATLFEKASATGLALILGTVPFTIFAQKGMGETEGVARQAQLPTLQSIAGELVSIETHRCGQTTGRAPLGTHLLLERQDGDQINLHLGPAPDVKSMIEGLEPGQTVQAQAFRTEEMPENAYVAQRIQVGDRQIEFRDADTLRPGWAERYSATSRYGRGRWMEGGKGMYENGQWMDGGKGMYEKGQWMDGGTGMGQKMRRGHMHQQQRQGADNAARQRYGPCWW